jgi:hypothetical protein
MTYFADERHTDSAMRGPQSEAKCQELNFDLALPSAGAAASWTLGLSLSLRIQPDVRRVASF